MYSMQGPPGENEPNTPRPTEEDQELSPDFLVWAVRFWLIAWLVGIVFTLWQSETARLHTLHAITRLLHLIAKSIGSCALVTEQAYYETVNSLH